MNCPHPCTPTAAVATYDKIRAPSDPSAVRIPFNSIQITIGTPICVHYCIMFDDDRTSNLFFFLPFVSSAICSASKVLLPLWVNWDQREDIMSLLPHCQVLRERVTVRSKRYANYEISNWTMDVLSLPRVRQSISSKVKFKKMKLLLMIGFNSVVQYNHCDSHLLRHGANISTSLSRQWLILHGMETAWFACKWANANINVSRGDMHIKERISHSEKHVWLFEQSRQNILLVGVRWCNVQSI